MTKNYIVGFKGKSVSLYDQDGKIIRKFLARAKVVNAHIDHAGQNPVVAITTEDGKFELYKADGKLIRRN